MNKSDDPDLDVARIAYWWKVTDAYIRRVVFECIDREFETYSGDVRRAILFDKLSLNRIQIILTRMESEGQLESVIRNPPHPGAHGGGLQRRYYRRTRPTNYGGWRWEKK